VGAGGGRHAQGLHRRARRRRQLDTEAYIDEHGAGGKWIQLPHKIGRDPAAVRSSSGGDAGEAFCARPPRVPDPRSGTSFRGTRFAASSRVPGDYSSPRIPRSNEEALLGMSSSSPQSRPFTSQICRRRRGRSGMAAADCPLNPRAFRSPRPARACAGRESRAESAAAAISIVNQTRSTDDSRAVSFQQKKKTGKQAQN
jgi:hypothetical protein